MKAFFGKIGHWIIAHKIITVAVAVLLCLVVVFSCLSAFIFNRFSQGTVPTENDLKTLRNNGQVYEHVVIFGVDGAGGYFDKMDTPGFDSVFKNPSMPSSVTYKGLSQYPTISAQNWGSMIHGVRCQKHKLTNAIADTKKYTDTKYPSFFKVYAERHPEEMNSLYSVVHWTPINYGIIEDMPQINKISVQEDLKEEANDENANAEDCETEKKELTSEEVDDLVAERTIEIINTQNPKILFTHFDCVDSAGHGYGWDKPEFVQAMKKADECIAKIYQACVAKGWKDNTLFICISDHGHETWGGHGSNNYNVRCVTFAVAGNKGNVINGEPGHVVTQDMASVVLYALGEKQPDSWESKVPKHMFSSLKK